MRKLKKHPQSRLLTELEKKLVRQRIFEFWAEKKTKQP